jgi:hypothetical protein
MTKAQRRIVELIKDGFDRLNLEDRPMLSNGIGGTERVRHATIVECARKGLIRFNYDTKRYEAN